jgi:argonaute-like protein implicated in RNA metabolism and viral defense
MRNQCLDKFAVIAQKASEERWNEIVRVVTDANFEMKVKDLTALLLNLLGIKLNYKEKEAIWETFKVK